MYVRTDIGLGWDIPRFKSQSEIFHSRRLPVTRVGGRLLGRYWYNTAFSGH